MSAPAEQQGGLRERQIYHSTGDIMKGAASLVLLISAEILAGCSLLPPIGPADEVNLTWVRSASDTPAGGITIRLDGFGVDDTVMQLAGGNLPLAITRSVANTGAGTIPAGYTLRSTMVRMVFKAVGSTAAYIPADTIFDCRTSGMALGAGGERAVTFVIGGSACPMPAIGGATVTQLPVGLYRLTMMADDGDAVSERCEADNRMTLYLYVPTTGVQRLKIDLDRPDRVHLFETAPPGRALTFTVVPTPPPPGGDPTYHIYFRTPTVGNGAGDRGDLVPVGFRMGEGVAGTQVVGYDVTPVAPYLGSINDILCNCYEENIDTRITAISQDGSVIAQRIGRVSVRHEGR
jgi:hypothetical protein